MHFAILPHFIDVQTFSTCRLHANSRAGTALLRSDFGVLSCSEILFSSSNFDSKDTKQRAPVE